MASVRDKEVIVEMKALLTEAGDVVCHDRDETYGVPEFNLSVQERLVRVVILAIQEREAKGMPPLAPGVEGAICSILLKISRIIAGPTISRDTLLDIIGYTLCLIRANFVANWKEPKGKK